MLLKRILISGYRSYELNVFKNDDPKIVVIKKCLKQTLLPFIEDGLEWVVIGGELGIEQWAAEVVFDLQVDFPDLKLGILFPYHNYGNNWKEDKQLQLQNIKSKADFWTEVSKSPYENPSQLKNQQTMLLHHTDGALLVYDLEHEGKPLFLYRAIEKLKETTEYFVELIDFDALQQFAYDEIEDF